VHAASETNALSACGIYDPKPLGPGQMLIMKNGDVTVKEYAKSPRKAHCIFEWVYFANVSSIIDHRSVYKVRRNLGKHLAKTETLKVDGDTIIVPVPETSKTVCDSMAYHLGTSTNDGLIRNRYLGRTFIEGRDRADRVRNKFTVLREIMEKKKVILVDDSIVRGTTSRNLIHYIKEVGRAKEVHMRVSCPPIMAPCFYGIDMSTIKELFAPRFHQVIDEKLPDSVLRKMASEIGADSLRYQTHSALVDSIGMQKGDLCMACLNADYPTKCGMELYLQARENFKNGTGGRTHE
jgi:amidophosphoribosyltransferase